MNYEETTRNNIDEYNFNILKEKAQAYDDQNRLTKIAIAAILAGIGVIIAIIALCMWLFPQYGVWSAEQKGKAQLAEAEYSKQTQIQEAQSNLEAEKLNAKSEIERANGAAEARKTEGLGMTAEQYIQYLWVKKLDLSKSKTIYLPTEGGLPKVTMEVEK